MFSTLSSYIYFPALDPMARDLGVSLSLINLSVTTYMIVAGIAPAFMGSLAVQGGRRPAYILIFVLVFRSNIGLALQNLYPALLALRMVQSAGSYGGAYLRHIGKFLERNIKKFAACHGRDGGIGRATTLSFSRAGANKTILISRTQAKLEETQKLLPGGTSTHIHACDVADEKSMMEIAAKVGTWDILVLAAGYISTPASVEDSGVDEWWKGIELRTVTQFHQGFAPPQPKSIVTTTKSFLPTAHPTPASIIAYSAAITFTATNLPGLSAYNISKLAIVMLVEYNAAENTSVGLAR
ncbi:hypothetical protein BDV06DRAFT_223180 [Aspergillus oleicola]